MRRRPILLTIAILAVLVAAVAYWWYSKTDAKVPTSLPAAGAPPARSFEPVYVQLDKDSIARAGIQSDAVKLETIAGEIRVPGTVEPDQYRNVTVATVVGGTVREVSARLGDMVRRGAQLARVFSREIAEAQMKYLTAAAMVDADHRKVVRTEKLLEIGAASRQELETARAEHAAHAGELEAARENLLQLGINSTEIERLKRPADISSVVSVRAPIDGTVLARNINPGQVISPDTEVFVIADLSRVWIIGEIYEQNFRDVRAGSSAKVTTAAYPGRVFYGKVTYVEPSVNPETRTSRARVEVPNPAGLLRLKMFVEVIFPGEALRAATVPEEAVQFIGDRAVVYQPDKTSSGRFLQKQVVLGKKAKGRYQILGGLQVGETVVTSGSFLLRSESLRMQPQQ